MGPPHGILGPPHGILGVLWVCPGPGDHSCAELGPSWAGLGSLFVPPISKGGSSPLFEVPPPIFGGFPPHFAGAGPGGRDPAPFPRLRLPALQETGGKRRNVRLQNPAPRPGRRLQGGDTWGHPRGTVPPPILPCPPPSKLLFSPWQPRDVTNFTVGGFAPMSPRISSPMHPSGAGECWGCPQGVPKAGGGVPKTPPTPL